MQRNVEQESQRKLVQVLHLESSQRHKGILGGVSGWPYGQTRDLRCLCFSVIPSWLSLQRLTSSHQTLRSCSDSRVGAFRSIAHTVLSGDICDGGNGSGSLLLLLLLGNGSDSRGSLLLDNGSGGGSSLLLLLVGLALVASGLAQRAAEVAEERLPLVLLGLLSSLGLGLSGGWGSLSNLSRSRSVLDLRSSIDLGLRELLLSSGRLGAVLVAEELAEAEVLLLLGRCAGGDDSRLGLVLVQLSSSSLIGREGNGSGLLDRLSGLDGSLALFDGSGSKASLSLPLLGGRRLELLDKGAEDGGTLRGLGLLGGGSGSDGLLSLGSLLYGNSCYGGSRLSSSLSGLDNVVGIDGGSGGDCGLSVKSQMQQVRNNVLSSRWGAVAAVSSVLVSGSSLTASLSFLGSLSFLPRSPPRMLARLPRETERDLLLAFFALASSEEELEEDPVRAGAAAASEASASASLGAASMLFLGAAEAPASAVGFPASC
jgi:hypothetical protein